MVRQLYKLSKIYVNGDTIKIVILFIPLSIIIFNEIRNGEFVFRDFFDTSILVSFLSIVFCETLAKGIIWFVERQTEDAIKLTTDYESLITKYSVDKDKMISKEGIITPTLLLYQCKISSPDINLILEKDEKYPIYNLPKQIADNSANLFRAHKHSIIFNNHNIRLNDFTTEGNSVILKYGFTTYFDSLITNRAADFPFLENRTIREIFEPGPFLKNLSESKLSNHLGFNGFVELNDGNFIFVRRKKNLSIAKDKWQQSVGASLKTSYCLDINHNFNKSGLYYAIQMEIHNELKIDMPASDLNKESKNIKIFAFYRDLVEAGKPQFVFYYKATQYNKNTFENNFHKIVNEQYHRNNNVEIDGTSFSYYTIEDIKAFRFALDSIQDRNGDILSMTPSSIASLILLLQNYAQ